MHWKFILVDNNLIFALVWKITFFLGIGIYFFKRSSCAFLYICRYHPCIRSNIMYKKRWLYSVFIHVCLFFRPFLFWLIDRFEVRKRLQNQRQNEAFSLYKLTKSNYFIEYLSFSFFGVMLESTSFRCLIGSLTVS